MSRSSVDLPEPDGPITAATSPAPTVMSSPRSAATGPPGVRWIRISPDPTTASAIGPLGPCRPSVLSAVKKWNGGEDALVIGGEQ